MSITKKDIEIIRERLLIAQDLNREQARAVSRQYRRRTNQRVHDEHENILTIINRLLEKPTRRPARSAVPVLALAE